MEQLIVSFNAVVPLFIMMVMGYYASRTGLLSPGTVKEMNRYVFRVFFPILVFYNIYQADLSGGINFKLLLFAGSAIVVFMAAVTFMYARIEQDPHKRGVMSQASFRSNFVSFVIPIAATLYGEKELGSLPLLIATMIPKNTEGCCGKSCNPRISDRNLFDHYQNQNAVSSGKGCSRFIKSSHPAVIDYAWSNLPV